MDFTFIIICIFTILPLTVLLHELGHFYLAQICQAEKIVVTIGVGKKLVKATFRNMSLVICILPIGGKTMYELIEEKSSRARIISIGGPLMNGVVAFLLLVPGFGTGDQYITIWFQWLALFNLWMFVINFLPLKIGDYYSDGWMVLLGGRTK